MKKILFILVAIMLVSSVSALSLNENVIREGMVPELNQPAIVELNVNDAAAGTYGVFTLNNVLIDPEDKFELDTGSNKVDLKIYPTSALDVEGKYAFTYTLRKETGETYESSMTVDVVPVTQAFEISSEANSPESGVLTFFIKSNVDADLKDLDFKFSSVLFDFEETFDLDAYDTKEFEMELEDLERIEAGSYIVEAEIMTTQGVKIIEGKVYIGEKKGVESREDLSGLLIRTQTIDKINVGNVVEDVSISVQRGAFSRLFTTFNIDPDNVDRDGFTVNYAWNRRLGPSEIFTVKAKTNYILPVLIVIGLALLVWGYKRYTTKKVDIVKSVTPVKTKGGHFALRVKISVKAKEFLENVSLVDKIPQMVKVHEKFETSKPDKVDTKNRRLEWNLGDLQSGEERSFSYILYSKIGIVGKFALPESVAVFEKNAEIHEVKSNSVYFLSEQSSKD